MAAENLTDFLSALRDETVFESGAWYNGPGDCIEVHLAKDEYYAQRVDDVLTVFRSQSSGDIVGCQVKGMVALLQKTGSLGLEFRAKKVPLGVLFLLSFFQARDPVLDLPERQNLYRDLGDRIGKTQVDVPPDLLAAHA